MQSKETPVSFDFLRQSSGSTLYQCNGYKIWINICMALTLVCVKVLYYKSEGRWFDSRWCHWNLSLT